ncbi:hypothetical protein [Phenylobacterium sp.]|uniref:hypothetical protein n=1 Tax=Phenylobacterium sp. TaxID=1871053 RepID=UPI00273334B2|nr:hypothetical protein [Phenylobacterium sp.]MDP3852110.1 hypothetical protein [Phenylobacterium sp.]
MQTIDSRARAATAGAFLVLVGAPFAGGLAHAQPKTAAYATMASPAAYRTESRSEEIALARSAAPASISDKAEVLVLGDGGYETAAKGSNGFVCIVNRSWANDFGDVEFWNPKIRSPICFNSASVRSVLPTYLTRTTWVLSGTSVAEMQSRTKAALGTGAIRPPEAGAMCYMMSKQGYASDKAGGPWRAHLMFFVPQVQPEAWGANLPGVPVMGGASSVEPLSVFFVPVERWSDGSPDHQGH